MSARGFDQGLLLRLILAFLGHGASSRGRARAPAVNGYGRQYLAAGPLYTPPSTCSAIRGHKLSVGRGHGTGKKRWLELVSRRVAVGAAAMAMHIAATSAAAVAVATAAMAMHAGLFKLGSAVPCS